MDPDSLRYNFRIKYSDCCLFLGGVLYPDVEAVAKSISSTFEVEVLLFMQVDLVYSNDKQAWVLMRKYVAGDDKSFNDFSLPF